MNLQKGSILSELQFYVVKEIKGDDVIVNDEVGTEISISKEYADTLLNSADNFTKEESVTATKLADIFISSTRIAMTACYKKKDENKSAKAIKKEKDDRKQRILSANVHELPKLIDDLIENPVQSVIPGDERIIKGRHYGNMNDMGRVDFIDMEIAKNDNPVDSRLRQVDPRTLKYVIVNNVKYSLK